MRNTGTQEMATHGGESTNRRSLRLLFVEDDDDFRQVLRVLLARAAAPHPVEGVFRATVSEARQVVAEEDVDAIVSDFNLPDGTGVELLEHARVNAPDSRRVMLTGVPETARKAPRFQHSVHTLWDKSLDPSELQARLEHLLRSMIRPAV